MKYAIRMCMFAAALFPVWLVAQTNYRVISLPTLGGTDGPDDTIRQA